MNYIPDSNCSSDGADKVAEKVVFSRFTKGKPQYYIKWKGRDESNNTWESKESAYCQDLIEEYEKQRSRDKFLKKQASKPNEKQKKIMVKFMAKHPDLANNRLPRDTSSIGKLTFHRLWQQLRFKLNASGPPHKNCTSWKEVFAHEKRELEVQREGKSQELVLTPTDENIELVAELNAADEALPSVKSSGRKTKAQLTMKKKPSAKKTVKKNAKGFENSGSKGNVLSTQLENILGCDLAAASLKLTPASSAEKSKKDKENVNSGRTSSASNKRKNDELKASGNKKKRTESGKDETVETFLKKQASKPNEKQKKIMVEFMAKHPDLANNRLPRDTSSIGKLTFHRLWQQLRFKLNASGPPQKNCTSWKEVFAHEKRELEVQREGKSQELVLTPTDENIELVAELNAADEALPSVKSSGRKTKAQLTMKKKPSAKKTVKKNAKGFENSGSKGNVLSTQLENILGCDLAAASLKLTPASSAEKSKKDKENVNSGRTSSASNKRKNDELKASGNKKKRTESGKDETDNDSVSDVPSRHAEATGFDKGLEAEKILGAADTNGGLHFTPTDENIELVAELNAADEALPSVKSSGRKTKAQLTMKKKPSAKKTVKKNAKGFENSGSKGNVLSTQLENILGCDLAAASLKLTPASSAEKSKKDKENVNSGRTSSASNKRKNDELKASGNKKKRTESGKDETDNDSVSDVPSRHAEATGFDKGLEAEKILSVADTNGGLHFLIQFKGVDQAEVVAASVANVKIPQMVIKFYEERLVWYSDNED